MSCEGCDIVQSDHAPQAGVAQGIFDGDLIRRRDGHQVELEEEQDEEVERRGEERPLKRQHTSAHAWMIWNDTQGEDLEPQVRCVNTVHQQDGARRAQNCALYTSVCFVVSVPLFRNVLQVVHVSMP